MAVPIVADDSTEGAVSVAEPVTRLADERIRADLFERLRNVATVVGRTITST